MAVTGQHPPAELLGKLHPMEGLSEDQLKLLSHALHLRTEIRGRKLLSMGSRDAFSLYLLKGRVKLETADGHISEIEAGSVQAMNPIAHLIPRQYDVTVVTPVVYFLIDNRLLDGLTNDSLETLASEELSSLTGQYEKGETENRLSQALLTDLQNDRLILPSLPDVAIKVGCAIEDEDTDAEHLAKIIQTDPVITTKLIRAANSALYVGLSPSASCTAAIIRLGNTTTHKLVLTFALRELFKAHSRVLQDQMRKLWKHSTQVAGICFVLAKLSRRFNPEHALLAGLLHDIGEVAILSYAENFPEIANNELQLEQVMKDMRGVIGCHILTAWGFLEDLVVVTREAEEWTREHTDEADYTDLVIVAQLHSYIGTPEMKTLPTLDKVPAFQKLDIGDLTPELSIQILENAADQIVGAQALLNS
ncbi:MAG: HDOD domain-containing protein [gamma proteobacterium endosymbiont of Lamellibrachia anaximandri]|nr:HDOD domain-containing protein [gamma proteobacterium endosymbiont of Lamellibrachia anaximandri]MBL3532302.1 HDOD domain-containing protein [gamma proteobacterium endosymbiont of Lamellibrachia anaximandri]